MHNSERRRHARLERNIPLKISSGDVDIVTETKNLSSAGALCLINKFITPMTRLKLHILLPIKRSRRIVNKSISCEGVVVRCDGAVDQDSFETAIFFSDISPRDSQTIHEFVESSLNSHEPSRK